MLVDAFAKVAAERGYAGTRIGDVTAAAGLPRGAFDTHFRDKCQCLLAAYDRFFDRLIEEIEDSMVEQDPWPRQVSAAVEAALGFVVESKGPARLFAVEALSVGALAIDRYEAAIQRIARLLASGRARSEAATASPEATEQVLIAGIFYLVTAALLTEDDDRLARLEPGLADILLLPCAGTGNARIAAA